MAKSPSNLLSILPAGISAVLLSLVREEVGHCLDALRSVLASAYRDEYLQSDNSLQGVPRMVLVDRDKLAEHLNPKPKAKPAVGAALTPEPEPIEVKAVPKVDLQSKATDKPADKK